MIDCYFKYISQRLSDVLVTQEEIEELMSERININSLPTGKMRNTDLIKDNMKSRDIRYWSQGK